MIANEATKGKCHCCGTDYSKPDLVSLQCHSEVAICGGCIDWLVCQKRNDFERVMPVLATSDVGASKEFWKKAGFEIENYSDDFAFASRNGVEFHLVGEQLPNRDRGAAYLLVRDVDSVHASWLAAGLPVGDIRDEPWGMREFNVVDPGGNRIRIGTDAKK